MRIWVVPWTNEIRVWIVSWTNEIRVWIVPWTNEIRVWIVSWTNEIRVWIVPWTNEIRVVSWTNGMERRRVVECVFPGTAFKNTKSHLGNQCNESDRFLPVSFKYVHCQKFASLSEFFKEIFFLECTRKYAAGNVPFPACNCWIDADISSSAEVNSQRSVHDYFCCWGACGLQAQLSNKKNQFVSPTHWVQFPLPLTNTLSVGYVVQILLHVGLHRLKGQSNKIMYAWNMYPWIGLTKGRWK
jgi:hypothetical protein